MMTQYTEKKLRLFPGKCLRFYIYIYATLRTIKSYDYVNLYAFGEFNLLLRFYFEYL